MNDTTFERVKESVSIWDYAEERLEHSRRGGEYVCPSCNSGGGASADSDSAFSITQDGKHFECFSCGIKGDIFDLIGIVERIDGKREQLEAVANWANLDSNESTGFQAAWSKSQNRPDYSQGREKAAAYIKASQERLAQAVASGDREPLEYMLQRGFTPDEIERFGFGYVRTSRADKNGWKNGAGEWVNGGRIVLPWRGCRYFYTARAMSSDVSKMKYVKPDNNQVGGQPLENPDALTNNGVYIVEGQLDAYALEAMGRNSIALGGAAAYTRTLDEIKRRGYSGLVVLMFDGDAKGRENQAKAEQYCSSIGLRFYSADFAAVTGYKDVCEAFAADREAAAAGLDSIKAAIESGNQDDDGEPEESGNQDDDGEPEERKELQDPAIIAANIYACEGYEEPIATGFNRLDEVTNGGLRSGLTVLGATSSAGKTTLCVQIGDYIAAHGRPVLFVSIEQSGRELVSKSLSRMMAQRGYKSVPMWAMNSPKERGLWGEGKTTALVEACNEYVNQIAPNLLYLSASKQPTVEQVEKQAKEIAGKRGVSPVVIVDYLQLLAPKNERDTDKRAADFNVSQLRCLARDMRVPVIAISSLNRTSYSGVIEMESYKESGGIEYAADLLLGLQPFNMAGRMGAARGEDARRKRAKEVMDEFKRKTIRECEIVVLKNRNGALPPAPLPVTFDCASSCFYDGVGSFTSDDDSTGDWL